MTKKEDLINKVFDGGDTSVLVDLNTTQADKFIDYIVDESEILKNARVVRMDDPIMRIAKIGISEDVLYPAQRGQALDTSKRVEATPDYIELISKEVIGEFVIYDDELENNIEKDKFQDHMMTMVAKQASKQLEKVAVYARKIANPVSLMGMFDGFIKRMKEEGGNIVDASDTGLFTDRYIDKEKLASLRMSIPTAYRTMQNKIFMHEDITINYEVKYEATTNTVNKYGAFGLTFTKANLISTERPVAVASGVATTLTASPSAGATTISVTDASGLSVGDYITLALGEDKEFSAKITAIATNDVTIDTALLYAYDHTESTENTVTETTLDGTDVIMTPSFNFIYGIQRNMRIEREREARYRRTVFIMTMRLDFQVENPALSGLLTNVKVK